METPGSSWTRVRIVLCSFQLHIGGPVVIDSMSPYLHPFFARNTHTRFVGLASCPSCWRGRQWAILERTILRWTENDTILNTLKPSLFAWAMDVIRISYPHYTAKYTMTTYIVLHVTQPNARRESFQERVEIQYVFGSA